MPLVDVPKALWPGVPRALLLEACEKIVHGIRIERKAKHLAGSSFHPFPHEFRRQFGQRNLLGAYQLMIVAFVNAHVQAVSEFHGDEPRHRRQVERNRVQAIAFYDVDLHVVLFTQLDEQLCEFIPGHGGKGFIF